MKLTIFTDGASRGNPGPASYGFLIRDASGKTIYNEGKYLGTQTNNFAEYSAVLSALEYVKKHFDKAEVTFFMDSKLVVEQLSGRYKIKSLNLMGLINKIKILEQDLNVNGYNHVRRESNKIADVLANQALDSPHR